MVAELSGSGTLAAMMLLAGTIMAAFVLCAARALWTLWSQDEQTENVQSISHLPDVTIATKNGTRYRRRNCGHVAAKHAVKEFGPCSDCLPQKYASKETRVVKTKCRFTAAFTTLLPLLCGAILGSLATVGRMMMIPGPLDAVKEQRQALGETNKHKTEEELALGDVRSSKEGTRTARRRQEPDESDETELMTTWARRSRKPNTHYEHREFYILLQEPQRVHRERRRHQREHDQEQERVHDQGLRGDRKTDATICFALREPRAERVLQRFWRDRRELHGSVQERQPEHREPGE